MSLRKIRIAAALLACLELAATLVILIVVAAILSHPSSIPAAFSSTNTSWSGVGSGALFAVMALAGFEGAVVLGRETVRPARAISLAIAASLVAAMAFFVLLSAAKIVGFGRSGLGALLRSATPLQDLASRHLGGGQPAACSTPPSPGFLW